MYICQQSRIEQAAWTSPYAWRISHRSQNGSRESTRRFLCPNDKPLLRLETSNQEYITIHLGEYYYASSIQLKCWKYLFLNYTDFFV